MDRLQIIHKPIERELEELKEMYDNSLQSDDLLLNEVLTYVRKRSGKLMRPILILLTAKLTGDISPSTYHAALAMELLHNATLVHDDIVDESEERRGRPSVNAAFNNKVAVLAGDYMLATALLHSVKTEDIRIIRIISTLGQVLAVGEIIQLENINRQSFSEEVYFDVIRKKTASLFAGSAHAGALSAGADEAKAEHARLFGEKIGIAFQIKDDIFDYYDSPTIGKPTGNDMREGKLTLPALYALNHCPDEKAVSIAHKIKLLDASPEETAWLVDFVKRNGGIQYAEEVMRGYRDQALSMIPSECPESLKEAFTAFIDYVIERER